jgi:hypothetical protein
MGCRSLRVSHPGLADRVIQRAITAALVGRHGPAVGSGASLALSLRAPPSLFGRGGYLLRELDVAQGTDETDRLSQPLDLSATVLALLEVDLNSPPLVG